MKTRRIRWWHVVLIALVIGNLALYLSGKWYYYKALVYNYVDIDDLDLFAYRTIESGNPEPWPIGTDYNKVALSDTLQKTIDQYRTVAFLVIKDDSIRHEQYHEGYGTASLSNSFSMAKSVVGLLIGIAVDEGKIKSLDDPIYLYYPEYGEGENRKLTIRHLLAMSSGLDYDEGYASLTSPTTRSYYDTKLREQMNDLCVKEEPGKNFEYRSSDTQVLSFVLKTATGKTVSEYASEKLWKPLGAEHDAQWSLDREEGDEKAYCCIYSNARDFARIGKLILNKGRWNDKQIVSEGYISQSLTPAPIMDGEAPNVSYGFQWWIREQDGKTVYYARGILGQYIFVIPSENIIIVRLGHERGEKDSTNTPLDMPVFLGEVLKIYGKK
ncbi:MAG: serine hydrolase domain-containing protein [Bacteroidota bacterium]